jgi:HSP20 family molecular chaperone IbpA
VFQQAAPAGWQLPRGQFVIVYKSTRWGLSFQRLSCARRVYMGVDMVELAIERPFGNVGRKRQPDPAGGAYYSFYASDTWAPPVNLYETKDSYLVCVDLAGVDKTKIDIEVGDGELTLRGHRPVPWVFAKDEGGDTKVKIHVMEIDHGGFCRTVEIPPDAAREQIIANYLDGMLWIEIPKK